MPSKLDALIGGAANGAAPMLAPMLAAGVSALLGKSGAIPDKGFDWYYKATKDSDQKAMDKHPNLWKASSLAGLGLSSGALLSSMKAASFVP